MLDASGGGDECSSRQHWCCQRVGEIDQGVEAVAGGILYFEFVADTFGELTVGQYPVRAFAAELRPGGDRAMRRGNSGPTFVVGGVDRGAVGENHPHAVEGLVAVLLDPAAHAAGIVGQDAADLGAVDRGWVGADFTVELGQDGIGLAADDARFQLNLQGLVKDPESIPPQAQADEDGVGDGLAGEAGAGRPKGHRQPQMGRFPQDALNLLLVFDID